MKLSDFKKKYMGNSSKWNFEKFSIVCNKCGSKKIEFNGYLESEGGYYGAHSLEGAIIVKCHTCGNAFRIETGCEDDMELNTNGEAVINECLKCGDKISFDGENGLCKTCSEKEKNKDDLGELLDIKKKLIEEENEQKIR